MFFEMAKNSQKLHEYRKKYVKQILTGFSFDSYPFFSISFL